MEEELEEEARRGPGLWRSSEHVTPPPSTGRSRRSREKKGDASWCEESGVKNSATPSREEAGGGGEGGGRGGG